MLMANSISVGEVEVVLKQAYLETIKEMRWKGDSGNNGKHVAEQVAWRPQLDLKLCLNDTDIIKLLI